MSECIGRKNVKMKRIDRKLILRRKNTLLSLGLLTYTKVEMSCPIEVIGQIS